MNLSTLLHRIGAELVAAVLLVAVIVVPVWPGVFTIDSQAMLNMARLGEVDDWYSPVLVSLWRVVETVGLPPWSVFVGTTVVVVTALLALYRLTLPRGWSIVATAATVLFPPVYGLLGWVGRDVWFLAFVLVVVAALGWAAVRPQWRGPLLGLAFVAAWFAADARQNGFPVLAVVGGATAWFVLGSRRHRVLLVVGASVLAAVVGVAAHRAARVVTVQRDVSPEQVLYYQDLLSVSLRLDESQVPRALMPPGRLDRVRRLWVPAQVGSVLFRDDPPVDYRPFEGSGGRTQVLRDAWTETIRTHPFAYLAERADLYRRLLGLGDTPPGAWFAVSDRVEGLPSDELQQRHPGLNDARREYLDIFESGATGRGGPLHGAWIYVLLGLAGAVAIIVAGGPLRSFGWMLVALQLSLQIVLAFAATLLEYRFQLFQVVLGIAVAIIGARRWYVTTRTAASPDPPGDDPRPAAGRRPAPIAS